jgi:hypothetical protein
MAHGDINLSEACRHDIAALMSEELDIIANVNSFTDAPSIDHVSSYFDTELAGRTSWIQPPLTEIKRAFEYYHTEKLKDPAHTGAFFCLPDNQHKSTWAKRTRGMVLVTTISRQDRIGPIVNGRQTYANKKAEIWYDAPARPPPIIPEDCVLGEDYEAVMAAYKDSKGKPAMVFHAHLGRNSSTCALIDSGATGMAYIDLETAKAAGAIISYGNHGVHLTAAGGKTLQIKGKTLLHLRVGGYFDKIPAMVVDTLVPGIGLILGDDWLITRKVNLDYDGPHACIKSHQKSFKIYPLCRAADYETTAARVVAAAIEKSEWLNKTELMSAKQAIKAIRKGREYYMIVVRDKQESKTQAPSPSPKRTHQRATRYRWGRSKSQNANSTNTPLTPDQSVVPTDQVGQQSATQNQFPETHEPEALAKPGKRKRQNYTMGTKQNKTKQIKTKTVRSTLRLGDQAPPNHTMRNPIIGWMQFTKGKHQ